MILYYITDRRAFNGYEGQQQRALLDRVAAAATAGVDYIQLREKDMSSAALELLAKGVLARIRAAGSATKLLINEYADVALAAGADGVHLPGGSLPASEVRALWMRSSSRPPIIGVSAHKVSDVRYAEAHGADFAVLAPVFEKPNTDIPGLGLETLAVACRGAQRPENTESAPESHFPVLALGGVTLGNAAACLKAGAAGIAGIRLFQEGDIADTVRRLRGLGK